MGNIINREKYIYIVDDAFISPAHSIGKDTDKIFYNNELKEFTDFSDDMWMDINVKNLCSTLISKGWLLSGFSHPNHLLNKLESDFTINPAIIIYDWDYVGLSINNETVLKEILTNYPVYIFIYTGCDKIDEINTLINSVEFIRYKRRIFILDKNNKEESSVLELIQELNSLIQNDFSFKFGNNIRKILLNGIDKTLSNFSNMDIREVMKLLNGDSQDNLNKELKQTIANKIINYIKTSKSVNDIVEKIHSNIKVVTEIKNILISKIENSILSSVFPNNINTTASVQHEVSESLMRELWSYRLYNQPTDNIVRTGDIIIKNGSDSYNELYLVITDNCSLARFKDKTNEILNLIKLEQLSNSSRIKVGNVTSLTNISNFSGTNGKPLLLPYVAIDNNHIDYILYMQNHMCIQEKYEGRENKAPLLYDEKFNYTRICSISSEFMHPLVGTIINNLFGWGCTDYPQCIQADIKNRCNAARSGSAEVCND